MKKIVFAMAALLTISLSACSQSNKQKGHAAKRILIRNGTLTYWENKGSEESKRHVLKVATTHV
ncbi:MAG: hypothetical protein IK144_02400 [Bacteroidaceae bacterium]|nr:hypothetical protein [Bacteroidaceae bacterium]